jgi:hypothetical protein
MSEAVYPVDDTHGCRNCEVLITQEEDLCEDCHSDWISWLMARDMERSMQEGSSLMEAMQAVTVAAYAPGRTLDSDASRLSQLSGWLPDTDGPEGTPF